MQTGRLRSLLQAWTSYNVTKMSEPRTGMSSFAKAAMVVMVGIVLFGSVLLFLGWLWWRNNRGEIMESTSKAREDGWKTGESLNEQECLNLSVSRTANRTGFTDVIANGVFLGACLERSKPVKDFCKDVPKDSEFTRSIQWRKTRCKEIKLTQNQCSALLSVVQSYCHIERKRLGKQ